MMLKKNAQNVVEKSLDQWICYDCVCVEHWTRTNEENYISEVTADLYVRLAGPRRPVSERKGCRLEIILLT